MKRKPALKKSLAILLALLVGVSQGVMAQTEEGKKTFKQEELDQLLAPVALYPGFTCGPDPDGFHVSRWRWLRPRDGPRQPRVSRAMP